MSTLKDCDELFLQYFDRWLDNAERTHRGFTATRPDMLQSDSLIGLSPSARLSPHLYTTRC
jgi:hypothetical protein